MILSAPLIVKDEAPRLGKCLRSLDGVADEIIVLDTGSTDGTMDVARQYTDLVFASERFTADIPPEQFHFGDARNEALAHCKGDWILSIDADEQLHQDGLRTFIESAKEPYLAIALRYLNRPGRTAWGPRVFPRIKETRWIYRCHEQPQPWSEEHMIRVPPRYGWIEAEQENRTIKERRNLLLLKQQMIEDGHLTAERAIVLADTYRRLGVSHFPEAIGYYTLWVALLHPRVTLMHAYIYAMLADSYSRIGFGAEALETALRLVRIFPAYEHGWLILAETYRRLNEFELAVAYYRKALSIKEPMPVHPNIDEPIKRDVVQQRIDQCETHMPLQPIREVE